MSEQNGNGSSLVGDIADGIVGVSFGGTLGADGFASQSFGRLAGLLGADEGRLAGLLGADEEDLLGALGDVLGDPEVLGAIHRAKARTGRRMILPGVQNPGERRQWLPFPITAVGAGVVAGTVQVAVTTNPQRPYRGNRILIAARGFEAGAAFSLADMRIANVPQALAAGNTPIEAFGANAFGLDVDLDSSQPGVEYLVQIRVDARGGVPTAGEVHSAVFGHSLR
jgi:hypothetical protein